MKKILSNLNGYQKSAIITLFTGLIVFAVLSIISIFKLLDFFIPLGIILGTSLIGSSYLIINKIEKIDDDNKKITLSMAVNAIRLFLLVGLTVLSAVLMVKLEITIFNPFGFVGGYLFGSTVSIIIMTLEKKKC